jgi:hypothetical protein
MRLCYDLALSCRFFLPWRPNEPTKHHDVGLTVPSHEKESNLDLASIIDRHSSGAQRFIHFRGIQVCRQFQRDSRTVSIVSLVHGPPKGLS